MHNHHKLKCIIITASGFCADIPDIFAVPFSPRHRQMWVVSHGDASDHETHQIQQHQLKHVSLRFPRRHHPPIHCHCHPASSTQNNILITN